MLRLLRSLGISALTAAVVAGSVQAQTAGFRTTGSSSLSSATLQRGGGQSTADFVWRSRQR